MVEYEWLKALWIKNKIMKQHFSGQKQLQGRRRSPHRRNFRRQEG